jgi:Kelch motif/Galactose oxidase, central domain
VTLTAGQTATSDNFGYVVSSGPVTPMYTIGGTVSGLAGGATLSLQNNGGDTLTVSANGIFTFATGSATGAAYAVTISAQPSGQTCAVSGGSGTVGTANIGNVAVSCTAASVATNAWTWVSGSDTPNALGSYGTKGVAAAGNVPGARFDASSWIDAAGNLWLFGGGDGTEQVFNDLWKYNPATKLWTWVSGSSNNPQGVYGNQLGVYGTQGVAAAANVPGARSSANSWIDSAGNLWLFGGEGWDSQGNFEILNDLWKFAPSTGLWTWVGGSNVVNTPGIYGTQGVSAAGNVPGARQGASAWTDASGHFWLFGGSSYDAPSGGTLNDLWTYNPSSGQWTWVSGSNGIGAVGVYGTQGVASAGNVPSARYQASSWIDPAGNFWIFGGFNGVGIGNDLWKYSPSTGLWTWVSGSDTGDAVSIFGTQGQAAASNVPGGRTSASSWTDAAGNLWLFGGGEPSSNGEADADANDFWEFSPSTGEWTWIGGSQTTGAAGIYGTEGAASAGNMPGARVGASSWTDGSGNFWLFGGAYTNVYNDLWNYVPAQ